MGAKKSKPSNSDIDPTGVETPIHSAVLHRNIGQIPPMAISDSDNEYRLDNGSSMYDASGGAAVASLGHGYKERIGNAIMKAVLMGYYFPSLSFSNKPYEALCRKLVSSTHGCMAKAWVCNSGSDAVEAAIKLALQFFYDQGQEEREWFIAREQSYHGATTGALALSGHRARRKPFERWLPFKVHHIPACNEYRDRREGESDSQYVARKAGELEAAFQKIGPGNVVGFFAEPVVGAALGCAAPPPGYLKEMKKVCRRHGALFISDEIMCGMGRTGTLHAWEYYDIVPDIQVIGKGLAAGAQPIGAMLCGQHVLDALAGGIFVHGHTFQGHPVTCAAAVEVLKIIEEDRLLENVRRLGDLLEKTLLHEALGNHPNVGSIRGVRFFMGLEFVKDKATKEPFDVKYRVYEGLREIFERAGIYVYPGNGTMDGEKGDHLITAPPFNITEARLRDLVKRIAKVINEYFAELNAKIEKEEAEAQSPKL